MIGWQTRDGTRHDPASGEGGPITRGICNLLSLVLLAGLAASSARAQTAAAPPHYTTLPLTGPASYCANPGVKAAIIREMNDTSTGPYLAGAPVYDIQDLATLSVSNDGRLFACHGIFEFINGAKIPAIFQIKSAVGHGALAGYVPDRAAGSI